MSSILAYVFAQKLITIKLSFIKKNILTEKHQLPFMIKVLCFTLSLFIATVLVAQNFEGKKFIKILSKAKRKM